MRIAIAYVNPPRNPGGKYGNVRTSAGQTIYVPVANMGAFHVGMECDLPTETQIWGKDTDAKQVTVAAGLPDHGGAIPQPRVEPPRSGVIPPHPAAPQVPQVPSQPYSRGGNDSRMIFATGIVGRAIGSGKFVVSDIDALLQAALDAWDRQISRTGERKDPPPPESRI